MFHHRITSVEPLAGHRLAVTFFDGTIKYYDMSSLIADHPAFSPLENEAFFRSVRVDVGGYGLCWSDDIDLACDELWYGGTACTDL